MNYPAQDGTSNAQRQTAMYQEYTNFKIYLEDQRQANSMLYRTIIAVPATTTPTKFWILEKKRFPLLSVLALNVLALVATTASAERNFSDLAFIHPKLRNCLKPVKAAKMCFVRNNLKVLQSMEIIPDAAITAPNQNSPDGDEGSGGDSDFGNEEEQGTGGGDDFFFGESDAEEAGDGEEE